MRSHSPTTRQPGRIFSRLLLPALVLALGHPVEAQQFVAKMQASSSTVQAGISFMLQIKVNTARAKLEALPEADGLEILSTGSQTNVTMDGARISRSMTYQFKAVARKEGEMTIGAVPVRTTGGTINSNPLKLTVTKGAAKPGTGSGRQPDAGAKPPDIVFAKVVPQKESAFVGEMVPVDVTVYFRSDIGVRHVQDQITLSGENLTTNKSAKPERGMTESGGHSFKTFTFHTAVAALKPGEITINPLDIETVISFEEKRRIPSMFGNDPFFRGRAGSLLEDEFLNRALSMPVTRQVMVQADAATLTAVALPLEGKPPGFTGAVGRFSLDSSPDRTEVKAGEPVTLTAKVRGIGNFDRVTSLAVESGDDWQSYPAKSRFEAADPTMTSGEKVFTQVMVPRRQGDATPQLRLDYFDPEEKRYATLRSNHPPIVVSGTAIVTRTGDAKDETGAPAPSDILHIRTRAPSSWRFASASLGRSTVLWAGNGTLALAAAALFFFRLRRNSPGREEREAEARRAKRRRDLLRALERPDLPDPEFCAKASEAITLCSPDGANRTPEEVIALAGSDFPGRQTLLEVARASGQGRYGSLRQQAAEIDRQSSIDALEELERALAKPH